jgi:hypothetical protein
LIGVDEAFDNSFDEIRAHLAITTLRPPESIEFLEKTARALK